MTAPLAIMRPAHLDARDTAIILAVATRWADKGIASSYRALAAETGIPFKTVYSRVRGEIDRHNATLIQRGFITKHEGSILGTTITRGPRFAGMQRRKGVVYEWVTTAEK